jgi:hypothetical protein
MAFRDGVEPATALILTLEMDGESFAHLDRLRRRHYPPERNLTPAHIALFYALPVDKAREIKALLVSTAERERPIEATITEVRALESGVAGFILSPRLMALRGRLAVEWEPWLGDRDAMRFQPHVTLAPATSDAEARRLVGEIGAELRLSRILGAGLHLWRYRGGPWEDERLFRFRG